MKLSDFGVLDFNDPKYSTYVFQGLNHVICCDPTKLMGDLDPEDPDDYDLIQKKLEYIHKRTMTFPMQEKVNIKDQALQMSDWKPTSMVSCHFFKTPPQNASDILHMRASLTYTETDICFAINLTNLETRDQVNLYTGSAAHPFFVTVAMDACMYTVLEKMNESK